MEGQVDLLKLLHSDVGRVLFHDFLRSEHAQESLEFWDACSDYYDADDGARAEMARQMVARYVVEMAPRQVNLPATVVRALEEAPLGPSDPPPPRGLFNKAQDVIHMLMKTDKLPRFVRARVDACKDARQRLESEELPEPLANWADAVLLVRRPRTGADAIDSAVLYAGTNAGAERVFGKAPLHLISHRVLTTFEGELTNAAAFVRGERSLAAAAPKACAELVYCYNNVDGPFWNCVVFVPIGGSPVRAGSNGHGSAAGQAEAAGEEGDERPSAAADEVKSGEGEGEVDAGKAQGGAKAADDDDAGFGLVAMVNVSDLVAADPGDFGLAHSMGEADGASVGNPTRRSQAQLVAKGQDDARGRGGRSRAILSPPGVARQALDVRLDLNAQMDLLAEAYGNVALLHAHASGPPTFACATEQFCSLAGHTADELRGAPYTRLFGPKSKRKARAHLAYAVRNESAGSVHVQCFRTDGQGVWCHVHLLPLAKASGAPEMFALFLGPANPLASTGRCTVV